MINAIKTKYDRKLNAHLATISPPLGVVDITVHVDDFDPHVDLNEIFLYNFDVDSNCIEFAFGEKVQHGEDKRFVTYSTDPGIHVPPFRIQITHQEQKADLSKFGFTVTYELRY